MSLDYDFSKGIREHFVDEHGEILSEAHCIIFGTMIVDLGEITEKNLDEWVFRISVCRLTRMPFGSTFYKAKEKYQCQKCGHVPDHPALDWYPSRDDMLKYTGLRTNVVTRSRKYWMNKVRDILEREAKYGF